MSERERRRFDRRRQGNVGLISSPVDSGEQVDLKVFKEKNEAITKSLAKGIDKNDRSDIKASIKARDKLRHDARTEIKLRDANIARDAFIPLSSATADIDERLVDRAMANGSALFGEHYEKIPDGLKELPSTDLQPKKVQNVAVELIIATQIDIRKNDKELTDKFIADLQPVTDDKLIYEVFNEITPQNKAHLADDMSKFYTYIAITSPDPNIEDKLIGPALARAYVDYRATLLALQLKQN